MINIRISIIVPVYNVKDYLKECLESLINQTYGNIEIIVINDGSTDNCHDIIYEYLGLDNRIKFIDQENKGLGAARNAGLEKATGNYIMFVDSDDLIDLQTCARLVEVAGVHNADVVIFGLTFFAGDSRKSRKLYQVELPTAGETYLLKAMASGGFTPTVCNKLFRYEVVKDLRFPEDIRHEDIYYSLIAIANSATICTDNLVSYHYRKNRQGSITNKLTIKGVEDLFTIYTGILQYFMQVKSPLLDNMIFENNIAERFNMEVMIKLIDGTEVENEEIILARLRKDSWLRKVWAQYILHGRLFKHRIMLLLFYIAPRLFLQGDLSLLSLRGSIYFI